MYKLIVAKKKQDKSEYDYVFKDFDSFYTVADTLSVPLVGRYSISIDTDSLEQIKEFIQIEEKYLCSRIYNRIFDDVRHRYNCVR